MYLYLLVNEYNKKYYLGTTADLNRRLNEHNGENRHFTGKIKGDWKLLGYKEFKTDSEARREEIRLKQSKNKKYILWYFKMGR